MFCRYCGDENEKTAKFCKHCGKALYDEKTKQTEKLNQSGKEEKESRQPESQITGKVREIPKKVWAGVAATGIGAVIIIAIFVAILNRTPTINLNDYLYFEVDGYDGYGSVKAKIDWDSIKNKYRNKISYTEEGKRALAEGIIHSQDPVNILDSYIGISLGFDWSDQDRLSNGDEISYTWDVGVPQLNKVRCNFEYTDGTYQISGLQELGSFDPFEDIELVFSGVEPEGKVYINNKGEKILEKYISCDRKDGLSNGDKVRVTIDEDGVDYTAQFYGTTPDPLEKEYTVNGLDSYVTSVSQISQEDMETLKEKADNLCKEQIADRWDEGEQLESFEYIGNYLLSKKEGEQRYIDKNLLWMIYRVKVRNQYANGTSFYDDTNTFYFYVQFRDLVVTADGELNVDMSQWRVPKDQIEVRVSTLNKSWYYYGYMTVGALYQDSIQNRLEFYNCENNVDGTSEQPEETGIAPGTASDNGYILPDSAIRNLTKADLEGLSAEECKIARNEIYARHGRKFDDEGLQSYFDSCDWYQGTVEPGDFQESSLSETEIANRNLIIEYEKEKGYR